MYKCHRFWFGSIICFSPHWINFLHSTFLSITLELLLRSCIVHTYVQVQHVRPSPVRARTSQRKPDCRNLSKAQITNVNELFKDRAPDTQQLTSFYCAWSHNLSPSLPIIVYLSPPHLCSKAPLHLISILCAPPPWSTPRRLPNLTFDAESRIVVSHGPFVSRCPEKPMITAEKNRIDPESCDREIQYNRRWD